MKFFLSSCLLLLLSFAAFAQRAPYKFSYQIDSLVRIDSDDQHQSFNNAYIGNYKKALEIFGPYHRKIVMSPEQVAAFRSYHAMPAQKYILEQARNAKIIIINEAHHIPLHRVFMESLLQGLRDEGFDMLGMETFDDEDSTISSRGYPVLSSGWYSAEPCYGNMIRKALSLKYGLFGYETDGNGEREVKQAENIARKVRENPHSKFVIYCGYDHLIKDTMPGADSWRHAMAGWLKLMTGIEPLTIDQVTLTETGLDSMDNPCRRMIHTDHSVVMVDDSSHSLKPKSKYNADISVYHPDTKYIHGRPDWQITGDKKTENISKKIAIGFPCMAFVYRSGEDYEKAVPTDVIEIQNREEDIHVILEKKQKNVIVLLNTQGQQQIIFQ